MIPGRAHIRGHRRRWKTEDNVPPSLDPQMIRSNEIHGHDGRNDWHKGEDGVHEISASYRIEEGSYDGIDARSLIRRRKGCDCSDCYRKLKEEILLDTLVSIGPSNVPLFSLFLRNHCSLLSAFETTWLCHPEHSLGYGSLNKLQMVCAVQHDWREDEKDRKRGLDGQGLKSGIILCYLSNRMPPWWAVCGRVLLLLADPGIRIYVFPSVCVGLTMPESRRSR